MESFLPSLLHELAGRCKVLADRLANVNEPELTAASVGAYTIVEQTRREVTQLLADPGLGSPTLLNNHLQLYSLLNQAAEFVEAFQLPFLTRFTDGDRRLTRLCSDLCNQIGVPAQYPLVAAFSDRYYWTIAALGLICAPCAEDSTLLRLPDLCHELGHIIHARQPGLTLGFDSELTAYLASEKRSIAANQRPPAYRALYDQLEIQWRDRWLREFTADMIATYISGPAFGWQHVRLCSANSGNTFRPVLGETAEHPADDARMKGILAVLSVMSLSAQSDELEEMWTRYLTVGGVSKPAEYDVCYPAKLIDWLAAAVVAGCIGLGLRSYDAALDPSKDVIALMADAWAHLRTDPSTYSSWEDQRLHELWSRLGV
jgi:hypothetical protein